MTTWELIKHPGVGRVIIIYQYILLLAFAFTAVDTLFLFTPINLGGIGFSDEYIAGAIGLNGVSQSLWLLLAFPPLHARFGTGGVLRLCAWAWPFFFICNPICHWFRKHNLDAIFYTVGVTDIILGSGVAMAFSKLPLPFPSELQLPDSFHLT